MEVDDGPLLLMVRLSSPSNPRGEPLRAITPSQITGGSNLAPITLQLSADEVQKALAALQADPAKK